MKKRMLACVMFFLLLVGCQNMPMDKSVPSKEGMTIDDDHSTLPGDQTVDDSITGAEEIQLPNALTGLPYLINPLSSYQPLLLDAATLIDKMTVIDRETGDRKIICNVPGCRHSREDNAVCFAAKHIPTDGNIRALYKEKYAFDCRSRQSGGKALGIVNLDGSDYKEIYRWPSEVSTSNFAGEVLINGHLYFCMVEEKQGEPIVEEAEDEIHTYMNIESAELCLYDLDFESEKVECLYRKHFDGDHDPYAYTVQYSDKRVLFGYRYKNKTLQDIGISMTEYMEQSRLSLENVLEMEKRFDVRYDTVIYDIEKRTAQVVEDALEQRNLRAGFTGKAFYEVVTYDEPSITEVRVMDLQTQEIKRVETPWKIEYGSADFLIMRPDPPQGNDIWYMLTSDGDVRKGNFSSKGFYPLIQQEVPELLYVAWVPIGRDSTSEEWKFEYIPREAFKDLFSETVDPIPGMSE
ncbi:MAG: hypothetical protein IK125_04740 [Lachnospiraceae bacterium]|nr:hypothetical protein [Lachnospiraceae bacterium]